MKNKIINNPNDIWYWPYDTAYESTQFKYYNIKLYSKKTNIRTYLIWYNFIDTIYYIKNDNYVKNVWSKNIETNRLPVFINITTNKIENKIL
jgi:hypothetical protein